MRIKVCCIQDQQELELAAASGVHLAGLISSMPTGWGPVPEERIKALAAATPPGVTPVLLTALRDPEAIIAQQRRLGAGALQLVDHLDLEAYPGLRAAMPGIPLIKVIHVRDESAVAEAVAHSRRAHALILDSSVMVNGVRQLGGTGLIHDWNISARIVRDAHCPVFLAGGLKPENVVQAIRQVRPYGVDVCSGVRINHGLDAGLLAAFVRNALDAGASATSGPA
ncbi:MAG: N-(5'-phosphoribosyl)anthranilate isomerase [Myxococcota bacterium]|nr:N-(5'-phosphoribosyl)anthranilate isomerase [Myxococcota bacterium]